MTVLWHDHHGLELIRGAVMALAAAVSCNERRKLAEEFAIATRKYSDAVAELASLRGATIEAQYQKLRVVADQARQDSESTGMELQRHIASHGC